MSKIEIVLVERENDLDENQNHYRICIDSDVLYVDNVLLAFENAMKGFGFVLDGKHLELVSDK